MDDKVLGTLARDHPRLILTEKRLAELKQLAGRDEVLARCAAGVCRQADAAARARALVHELRGPRLLHVSRECLRRVYALGVAWRWTGKDRYAELLRDNLLTVCGFADWNPSHFLDTAEMSHAVGVGYDWLHGWLDEADRTRIREGLIRLGLEPGLAAYRRRAWWHGSAYNWNQVCNSGLLIGALAIAETHPSYAQKIVPKARQSLPPALATYGPDGAWPEGVGYWAYATNYTAYGLAALVSALGTDFGLSKAKGLASTALFPLHATGPNGRFCHYADIGENARMRAAPVLFWLARRYDLPAAAAAEHALIARDGGGPLDLVWYVPPPKVEAKLALDRKFGGPVEVAFFRGAWGDPGALFATIKAGFNQVNHGHLDLGTFEMEALGVRWARDLGSDDYNLPGYWSSGPRGRRWTYYRLGSRSHNVCLLDDRNQLVTARSRMTAFHSAPTRAFAVVDLTEACRPVATRAVRGLAVVSNRRALLVQDELELDRAAAVAWGMTTDAKIEADGPRAVLTQDGKELTARLLAPAEAAFAVESAAQKPPEKPNKGVRRLMVRFKAGKGPVRIAVLLAPTWPDGKAVRAPSIEPLEQWK